MGGNINRTARTHRRRVLWQRRRPRHRRAAGSGINASLLQWYQRRSTRQVPHARGAASGGATCRTAACRLALGGGGRAVRARAACGAIAARGRVQAPTRASLDQGQPCGQCGYGGAAVSGATRRSRRAAPGRRRGRLALRAAAGGASRAGVGGRQREPGRGAQGGRPLALLQGELERRALCQPVRRTAASKRRRRRGADGVRAACPRRTRREMGRRPPRDQADRVRAGAGRGERRPVERGRLQAARRRMPRIQRLRGNSGRLHRPPPLGGVASDAASGARWRRPARQARLERRGRAPRAEARRRVGRAALAGAVRDRGHRSRRPGQADCRPRHMRRLGRAPPRGRRASRGRLRAAEGAAADTVRGGVCGDRGRGGMSRTRKTVGRPRSNAGHARER
mmetsp:Transcript_5000/g.16464  ORF Transcript_5000/g.16464 Transcript_5000/m.16464 type:complete len:396 (-) Transcript_5000:182-1369(-)